MVKLLSLVGLLFILLFTPLYPIYALDSTTPTTSTKSNTLKERTEIRKTSFEDRKEDIRTTIASREASLKEHLSQFKDRTKAEIVERVSKHLNTINKILTDKMTNHLDRLTAFADRLENRIKEEEDKGKDTSAASTSLANARTKIDLARAAVASQSAMDYTVVIASESSAKADVQAKREALHRDIQATWDIVKEARTAVADAIRTTASTLEGIGNKNGQQ